MNTRTKLIQELEELQEIIIGIYNNILFENNAQDVKIKELNRNLNTLSDKEINYIIEYGLLSNVLKNSQKVVDENSRQNSLQLILEYFKTIINNKESKKDHLNAIQKEFDLAIGINTKKSEDASTVSKFGSIKASIDKEQPDNIQVAVNILNNPKLQNVAGFIHLYKLNKSNFTTAKNRTKKYGEESKILDEILTKATLDVIIKLINEDRTNTRTFKNLKAFIKEKDNNQIKLPDLTKIFSNSSKAFSLFRKARSEHLYKSFSNETIAKKTVFCLDVLEKLKSSPNFKLANVNKLIEKGLCFELKPVDAIQQIESMLRKEHLKNAQSNLLPQFYQLMEPYLKKTAQDAIAANQQIIQSVATLSESKPTSSSDYLNLAKLIYGKDDLDELTKDQIKDLKNVTQSYSNRMKK